MALTSVTIKTTFDFSADPKVFIFEDQTDYASQSVDPNDVVAWLTIVAPNNVTIHAGSFAVPDILPGASTTNNVIQLPLNGDGTVMQGEYDITYTAEDTNDSAQATTGAVTVDLDYETTSTTLKLTYDIVAASLTSVDSGSYTVSGIVPSVSRLHTIFYPEIIKQQVPGLIDETGTAPTLVQNTVFVISGTTLQYSSSVVTTLVYDLGNNFFVNDIVNGTAFADVIADSNLCTIYCCLRQKATDVENNKGTQFEKQTLTPELLQMATYAYLSTTAITCGKSSDVTMYVEMIKEIGGCSDSCFCDDGEPVLAVGVGGGGNNDTVIVAAGSGITVTSMVVGSTTTYFVAMEASLLAKLNASYNTTVTAGTDITVVDSGIIGGLRDFVVNYTGTPGTNQRLASEVDLDFTAGVLPVVTVQNSVVDGSELQAATIVNSNSPVANWLANNTLFTVSNFFVGASSDYYPTIEVTGKTPNASTYILKPVITATNATDFTFSLTDTTGNAYTGNGIDGENITQLKIILKITS